MILNREEFFNKLNARLGSDNSEDSISFLEDMTDTYNDLETRANGNGEDWKAKYEENDKAWREKYKHRFFSSDGGNSGGRMNQNEPDDNGYNPEDITFDSLFGK